MCSGGNQPVAIFAAIRAIANDRASYLLATGADGEYLPVWDSWPLKFYGDRSFYVMRTDAWTDSAQD